MSILCIDTAVGEKKVSAILGDQIWEEMSDCIIRECLLHSIPTNSSQLADYDTVITVSKRHDRVIVRGFKLFICFFLQVIKQTEDFERHLKEMDYLSRDSTDLLKYARNVNCHFASKKCQDVIVAARKLMTSEMHNTVKVRAVTIINSNNCSRFPP